jgi:hypothetical protein
MGTRLGLAPLTRLSVGANATWAAQRPCDACALRGTLARRTSAESTMSAIQFLSSPIGAKRRSSNSDVGEGSRIFLLPPRVDRTQKRGG